MLLVKYDSCTGVKAHFYDNFYNSCRSFPSFSIYLNGSFILGFMEQIPNRGIHLPSHSSPSRWARCLLSIWQSFTDYCISRMFDFPLKAEYSLMSYERQDSSLCFITFRFSQIHMKSQYRCDSHDAVWQGRLPIHVLVIIWHDLFPKCYKNSTASLRSLSNVLPALLMLHLLKWHIHPNAIKRSIEICLI